MAKFPKLKLTNAGIELLANVQVGADTLTFTKMALGDGVNSTPITELTALVSKKIECNVSAGKYIGTGTYQIGAFFSNTEVTAGFWWREIGIFAKGNNGTEILYSYANAGDAGDYIPVGTDERIEKYIYNSLIVGDAENVTAEIDKSDSFILSTEKGKADGVATLDDNGKVPYEQLPEMNFVETETYNVSNQKAEEHYKAKNPHNITAETVGLEKVPNVATNDQTPTYTEATTTETLTSGEKLSVAFGKIKKAITDLISHIKDTTTHITSTERTDWNSKAPSGHGLGSVAYGTVVPTYQDFMQKGCGFYQASNSADSPHGIADWTGLLQITRNKDKGTETGAQLAFYDFNKFEPQMWLRTLITGNTSNWVEMLHSGNYGNFANAKIQKGTYVGTGGHGSSSPNTLTFNFKPAIVMLLGEGQIANSQVFCLVQGMTKTYCNNSTSADVYMTWEGNSVTWYADYSAEYQRNSINSKYYYVALG